MTTIRQKLKTIAKEKWTIKAFVAKEALTRSVEDIEHFFRDLVRNWCVCWMVNSLIYYSQTHKFFDKYYYEIIDVIEELVNNWWEIDIAGEDIKNKFAWLCFENVAYNIATEELGLEI